jgi:thiol-disulfide isomerase/thioredoxin
MKIPLQIWAAALCALFTATVSAQNSSTADTNRSAPPGSTAVAPTNNPALADLNDLVERINAKLSRGDTNVAENIVEFDSLLRKHNDADESLRAQILFMKAQLYAEVLDNPEEALAAFQQIKRDFSKSQMAGRIDDIIRMVQGSIEMKKVRRTLTTGAQFPGFDEKDLEGNALSLARYKGKVVLVDFWATWCVPCLMTLPDLIQAYGKYHDGGFEIIGISLDQDKAKLERFIKEKAMPWPQYYDGQHWQTKLAVKYGVQKIPTTYLLDREGKILAKDLHGEELAQAIANALKQK